MQTLYIYLDVVNKELMTMMGRNRIDEFGIQSRLFRVCF